jgi:hypothetical protein
MKRDELAQRIAGGLAGWLQQIAAQNYQDMHGEDTAQFVAAQIISAQHRWEVRLSEKVPGWGSSAKARIDVGLLPWKDEAKTWYGAIEIKWPGSAMDVDATRESIVQDIARVISVKTANLKAAFLVLGGSAEALSLLFDKPHPQAAASEAHRMALGRLLSREPTAPKGTLSSADLSAEFPTHASRVPSGLTVHHALDTELVGSARAELCGKSVGATYVWQCSLRRGAPTKKA